MRGVASRRPFLAQPRVGFKTTPGASFDALVSFAAALPAGVGAVAFVVQDTTLQAQLYATDIYTVAVPWSQWPGDCPNIAMSPINSVGNRLRYVDQMVGAAGFDAVVLSNECAWPSAEYYRDWLIAAVDACNARGWVCIPQVHNPGAPPLEWFDVLQPALCALEQGGHYFGVNVYPYWPVSLMTRDGDTQYTTWRHELAQPLMQCTPRWAVTELAPDGGGWLPDAGDTAAYINATWGAFDLVGVWVYNGTNPLPAWPLAGWSDADLLQLAGAITP